MTDSNAPQPDGVLPLQEAPLPEETISPDPADDDIRADTSPMATSLPEDRARAADAGETIGADSPGHPTSTEKDPAEWVTGDEPMTGAQRSYLDTLARQAGEQLPADLTKAEASQHIDRLQAATGRSGPAER